MQRSFSLALSVVLADDVDDTVPIAYCSILHLQKHIYDVLVLRRADNKIICQKTFYSRHH